MDTFDESYVQEILSAAQKAKTKTRTEFEELTRRDVAAGYIIEVEEAKRRYFEKT